MVNLTNRKGEKIMNARYANIKNFNRTVKTYKWLVDLFGDKEFTAKEFNEVKHNYKRGTYNSLAFLADVGIIKVSRTEKMTKEVEVPFYRHHDWMVDKNGNYVMSKIDWDALPEIAKVAMLAMNGKDFRVEVKETENVESERYFYTINPVGMLAWRKSYSRLLGMRADKIAGKIIELTEKRDALIACQF